MQQYYIKTKNLFGTDIKEVTENEYFVSPNSFQLRKDPSDCTNHNVMVLDDKELRTLVENLRATGEKVLVFKIRGCSFKRKRIRYEIANI